MLACTWSGFKKAWPKLPLPAKYGQEQQIEVAMDLRSLQKPLKEQYRKDPNASQIILRAKGGQTDVPLACSVDIGRAIYHAEAHKGVGGTGGISKDLPVGFERVQLHFDVTAPKATPEQLRGLREKTEQYCVVMQTLLRPPRVQTEWIGHD